MNHRHRVDGVVPSLAEQIRAWADEVRSMLPDVGDGTLTNRTFGSSGGVAFITGTPYAWSKPSVQQSQVQSRALEEYRRFSELLRVLLRGQSDDQQDAFSEDCDRVLALLQRRHSAFDDPVAAIDNARAALQRQAEQVDHLFSSTEGTLLIPDTNALYWNPALEEWRGKWQGTFCIVLLPTVLSEIDEHKEDGRNVRRQEKADRLVRQIGEYRRRGRLIEGVSLVRDVSRIMAGAVEPRMTESLPWLDATNADDRIIAACLEVIRQNVRARVVVVTRDVNLQNKLEYARLPFIASSDVVNASP